MTPVPSLTREVGAARTLADEALAPQGIGGRPGRYIPHVTLLRHAGSLETDGLPDVRLDWSYNQLELIHSITDGRGARYVPLARSGSA